MKNSASEFFAIDQSLSYELAFGYIRQLAAQLRESMKTKTKVSAPQSSSAAFLPLPLKETYKQVYNWQYVHCVDFWSIVLARTCEETSGQESKLNSLIYPLVQVSLGAIRWVIHLTTKVKA